MQQWLFLYKDLNLSPYNPRNSPGGKSPYPKNNSPDSHATPMEPKQYIKRQSTPNSTPQSFITSPRGADIQQTSHSSLKQPGSFSTNNVRFSNPPGVPFRTSLQSPSRQHQQPHSDNEDRSASLSNVEAVGAVFAALPNKHTLTADPTLPNLMRTLTDDERVFTRETYFQINPAAKGICQTARLDSIVIIHPNISVPVKGVLLDSRAST